MEGNGDKLRLHESVASLSTEVKGIYGRLDDVIDNHINHLNQRMNSLDSKFWWIITLTLSTLVGVIVSLVK